MNDEYDYEEEQSSLDSIGEVVRKRKNLTNNVHRNHNPKIGKAGLAKTNPQKTINHSNKKNIVEDKNENIDDNLDFSSIGDTNTSKTISGIYDTTKFFIKNKWLLIAICGGTFFFFILIIASVFLLQNADTLNYVSGNFYANERYQRLYEEINNVSTEYKSKYGITIDTHLIISVLTSYQDNSIYADDTGSGLYEILEEYGNRSKMSAMVETLAKYQVKTIANCDKDSSSMRKIASNDDSLNITNFWTSELSREKNYQCDSSASGTTYVLSVEQGNLDDENSGSVFYWNLIDEGFFKEYYPDYFANLSGADYEKKAAETLEYMYLYYDSIKKYDTTSALVPECNGTAYWWPIGSEVTTISEDNGTLLATGQPISSQTVTTFSGNLNSIDDGGLGITAEGDNINIIASKAGTVIYPYDDSQINYGNTTNISEGNIYGNYVIIKHSDSLYTKYSYLAPGSITVKAGDEVLQGQVIGKMGNSGYTNQVKLRFEISTDEEAIIGRVDPTQYVDINTPRSSCGDFPLYTTTLSKANFIGLMNYYCINSGSDAFCENFAKNAAEIYDVSVANNINPELVVVTAGSEQGWKKTCGYNFYGIGISNGEDCQSGGKYGTLADGIVAYANVIKSYDEGGKYVNSVLGKYNERKAAGCDEAGHGLPGTIQGMQSLYSWIGNYRYNPGGSGLGGCYYLNRIYGAGYCDRVATCTNKDNCPAASKTTICEQNDYTAWQVEKKILMRKNIFGL